jgi:hypothetical protein
LRTYDFARFRNAISDPLIDFRFKPSNGAAIAHQIAWNWKTAFFD